MRGLKNWVPDSIRDNFNENPAAKWIVLAIMVLVAPLVISKGIKGIKAKEIESKGRTYTGTKAVLVASGFVLSGLMLLFGAVIIVFGD